MANLFKQVEACGIVESRDSRNRASAARCVGPSGAYDQAVRGSLVESVSPTRSRWLNIYLRSRYKTLDVKPYAN